MSKYFEPIDFKENESEETQKAGELDFPDREALAPIIGKMFMEITALENGNSEYANRAIYFGNSPPIRTALNNFRTNPCPKSLQVVIALASQDCGFLVASYFAELIGEVYPPVRRMLR